MTSAHLALLVELDADAEVLRYIVGRARSVQEAQDHWADLRPTEMIRINY